MALIAFGCFFSLATFGPGYHPVAGRPGSPGARAQTTAILRFRANRRGGRGRGIGGLKQADFKANILITQSNQETEKWVLMPAADRPGAGRLRQLIPGKKYYLPIVVTDYAFPASEQMYLTAHVRFISPTGKILFGAAKVSGALAPDPRSPSVIVLNPVMDITSDPSDPLGTYTVRVTITDHVHSTYARAEEQFQLVPEPSAESRAGK